MEQKVIEIIKEEKALNIRALCRRLNNINSNVSFCTWRGHSPSQYAHCQKNRCWPSYYDVMKLVKKMIKEGKIKRKKLRLVDLDKDEKIVSSRRSDVFSLLYLNEGDLKESYHYRNTLLAYIT